MLLKTLINFISLLYPKLCYSCNSSLAGSERVICTTCQYNLPKTDFHIDQDNYMEQIFRGRIPVAFVSAFLYFQKGGVVQNLIHKFKYKGHKEIGEYMGRSYGNMLKESAVFPQADLIVPIPMHKAKEKKRGYNQSEIFAKGLAESLKTPIDNKNLVKTTSTQTQTKKSRFIRWENVETVFSVKDTEAFKGKHILLVDDVVTTGATIESCAQLLLAIENVKISIVTMAIAT